MLRAGRHSLALRSFLSRKRLLPSTNNSSFSSSQSSSNAIAIPSPSLLHLTPSSNPLVEDFTRRIRKQKYDELIYALDKKSVDPDEVWTLYVALLEYTHYEPLPAELHRRVLKNCTPSPQEVRNAYVKSLKVEYTGNEGDLPFYPYEARFATIRRQLRAIKSTLTREEFSVQLRQYAAVGWHKGAARTFFALRSYLAVYASLNPEAKDGIGELRNLSYEYALVLQAISFRLGLPCIEDVREIRRDSCARVARLVLNAMFKQSGPLPPICRDSALRVMKDLDNEDGFSALLVRAAGVDLACLDRHPLNVDIEKHPPTPLTTAALTTIVDFYGIRGEISKMVAAFEVLSTRYPATTTDATKKDAFEDDEDDYTFVESRPLPFARPNITTFNFLIRHCASAKNVSLAQHYVQRAIELDRVCSAQLREDFATKKPEEVVRPDVQVNEDTIRPLLGLANQEKNAELMKWTLAVIRWLRKRKREDFHHFAAALMERQERREQFIISPGIAFSASPNELRNAGLKNMNVFNTAESTSFFTSTVAAPPSATSLDTKLPLPSSLPPSTAQSSSSSSSTPSFPLPPPKRFDLALHVRLLVRDGTVFKEYDRRAGLSLKRIESRIKEALGRRVWSGQDVFLADRGDRVTVEREFWTEKVNFGVPPFKRKRVDGGE